jgi:hypothetical protein
MFSVDCMRDGSVIRAVVGWSNMLARPVRSMLGVVRTPEQFAKTDRTNRTYWPGQGKEDMIGTGITSRVD